MIAAESGNGRLVAVAGALALLVVAAATLADGARAASGNWDRAWGKSVDTSGDPTPQLCTVAASCVMGATGGLGGELGPTGIATDAAGNVYVADVSNHRIQKFDSAGSFERAWGKGVDTSMDLTPNLCTVAASCQAGVAGGLGGEFNDPDAIATDLAGNVYVADVSNHRIQKFDSGGSFQRAWGKNVIKLLPAVNTDLGDVFEICTHAPDCKGGNAGGLGGEFNFPQSVAADSAGNVHIVDGDNQRIQKFDSAGTFQRAWGKSVDTSGDATPQLCTDITMCQAGATGGLGGEFFSPEGVGTDTDDNVYIADRANNRIQKFDSTGTFQRAWGRNVIKLLPAVNTDLGDVFEICTHAPDCKGGNAGGLGGELNSPVGVATDAAADVYVSDNNHRIQMFDSAGSFQRAWGKNVGGGGVFGICTVAASCLAGDTGGLGGEFFFPNGVATDATGSLYVADSSNNRIQKFAEPALPATPGGAANPAGATGLRAAALKKCKRKKSAKARKKCKKNAKKLPV